MIKGLTVVHTVIVKLLLKKKVVNNKKNYYVYEDFRLLNLLYSGANKVKPLFETLDTVCIPRYL